MMDFLHALVLGVVEGVTEFLPISSTGHMILVKSWLGMADNDPFWAMFIVVIQLGAILSVVVYFFKRLWPFGDHKPLDTKIQTWVLWFKALVAVLPALVLGALFDKYLEKYLLKPVPVACALLGWGIIIIIVERMNKKQSVDAVEKLSYLQALLIGFAQCLAMIPGTSRSAATIISAMLLGCSRVVAAEFSFFLAIPTMVAAGAYSLLKHASAMTTHQSAVLAVGFITAFIVAFAVIAAFMRFITRNNFIPFGVYRILLGAGVLIYFLLIAIR
jgi:undecaprenyl-diphosphatase